MPTIDRATILTGPALVQYGGQTFWSKGDVAVKPVTKKFGIGTSSFGDVDERVSDRMVEVSFEPEGRFTAGLAAVLWPYAATAIGERVYGSADRALVVWSRDGKKLTVPNAALTGMPNISAGVSKIIQGGVKFTGLLKNSTDPSAAGAYYTLADDAYPGDAGFAVSDIITNPYTSAWGVTPPWDAFLTEAAWEISLGLKLTPVTVDSLGTVDMIFAGLTVSAKAVPVGPEEADILAAMLPASGLGNSIAAAAERLVIQGTGVFISVQNAGIVDSGLVYGSEKKRLGATEWKATRTISAGVADPLFCIGTSDPL